jgi:hypothetical protein
MFLQKFIHNLLIQPASLPYSIFPFVKCRMASMNMFPGPRSQSIILWIPPLLSGGMKATLSNAADVLADLPSVRLVQEEVV